MYCLSVYTLSKPDKVVGGTNRMRRFGCQSYPMYVAVDSIGDEKTNTLPIFVVNVAHYDENHGTYKEKQPHEDKCDNQKHFVYYKFRYGV